MSHYARLVENVEGFGLHEHQMICMLVYAVPLTKKSDKWLQGPGALYSIPNRNAIVVISIRCQLLATETTTCFYPLLTDHAGAVYCITGHRLQHTELGQVRVAGREVFAGRELGGGIHSKTLGILKALPLLLSFLWAWNI